MKNETVGAISNELVGAMKSTTVGAAYSIITEQCYRSAAGFNIMEQAGRDKKQVIWLEF